MTERVWRSGTPRSLFALVLALLAAAACNPDPRGRCSSDLDCRAGSTCSQVDHLCEAAGSSCTPACDGGTSCISGLCVGPGTPALQIIAPGNILSPSENQVQVRIISDSTVTLGQLSVTAVALDGGELAHGLVMQASADSGVALFFDPGAQAAGNLIAQLGYTSSGGDAGLSVSSAAVPARIDAVPPSMALVTGPGPDGGNGWFARSAGGSFFIDARLDDTAQGSGPDGGTLSIAACAIGGCTYAGALQGAAVGGVGVWRFTVPLAVADAGSEAEVDYTVDGVDNAGNHVDQGGTVLIDDRAPQTDAQITIVTAGVSGADGGGPWFPAGTSGEDVEVALGASDNGAGLDPSTFLLTFNPADIDSGQGATVAGYLATPPDGKVHFKVPTGRTSKREGALRFTIALADKVGNAAAPVAGQLLIDDLAPTTAPAITIVNRLIPGSSTLAGTIGEDGQLWFPAGPRYGLSIEVQLGASDNGAGIDPSALLLTFNSADLDSGQLLTTAGALASPPDGKVHFPVPTTRSSNREGPLRFTLAVKDRLGNASPAVAGQLLIDDLPPTVSLASIDYRTTLQPARSAVCSPDVSCGRGPVGGENQALRDDTVTATFTAIDCGSGINLGADPAVDCSNCGHTVTYPLNAQRVGSTAGSCANGSTNRLHGYTVQVPLGTLAQTIATDASGIGQAQLTQVAVDNQSSQGFSPTPTSATGGGVIVVSRIRWRTAALGGLPTGAPALLPLTASEDAGTPRELAVPVDGTASPVRPDAIDLLDSTGAQVAQVQLLTDAGTYDRATGDVAVSSSGTLWIAGTPASCNAGLSTCTHLWAARAGTAANAIASCPVETGAIGALAVRDADAGNSELAVVGLTDAGLIGPGELAGSFAVSTSAAMSCTHLSGTSSLGVASATGVSLGAGGQAFVSSASGFYSVPLSGAGSFSAASKQVPFLDSSGGLLALPAAPAPLLPISSSGSSSHVTPFFAAVDSLGSPSQQGLREAVSGSSNTWAPAAAPWNNVALTAPVSHTPVSDGIWIYTVDDQGTLQLSSVATVGGAITTLTAPPVARSAAANPVGASTGIAVSAPVLLQGSAAGASALVVQQNGFVNLGAVAASGSASTLVLSQQAEIAAFASGVRPPTPVVEARGNGAVAYLVDGAGTVWAFQLDTPPVAATSKTWPRPGRDSCNSRNAEGSCP